VAGGPGKIRPVLCQDETTQIYWREDIRIDRELARMRERIFKMLSTPTPRTMRSSSPRLSSASWGASARAAS
jgi:hypothetical protein